MCAQLPRIETRTHVDVVMHGLEQKKSTNTGALALSVFANATLHLFGNDLPRLPDRLWGEQRTPVVLFPVAGAQPVSDFRQRAQAGTLSLIVLDANWRQANRLRKKFAAQNIPFVTVDALGEYKLRNSPHEHGLSTFEAILHALAALEDVPAASTLQAFRIWQDRLLWTRGTIARSAVEGGIPEGARRA